MFFSQIRAVGCALPPYIVTNDELATHMDTSDTWIRERSGIVERRRVADGVGTSHLAIEASQQALKQAGLKGEDLDLILASTLSPDYYFPGIGVQIQHGLGCRNIPAIDLRAQCSGFSWGLATADAFMRTGRYKRILLVGAEIHSRILELSNRNRNFSVLFGDGAGAAILETQTGEEVPTAQNRIRGLIDHEMGSDGSCAEMLYLRRPGNAGEPTFQDLGEVRSEASLAHMDGQQVFKHAVTRMCAVMETLLTRNGLRPADLDLLIPHQANLRITEMLRRKFDLPEEKVVSNIHKYGNTTAATLPLCMVDAQADGRLAPGKLVATVTFGAGFTWGANLLRW